MRFPVDLSQYPKTGPVPPILFANNSNSSSYRSETFNYQSDASYQAAGAQCTKRARAEANDDESESDAAMAKPNDDEPKPKRQRGMPQTFKLTIRGPPPPAATATANSDTPNLVGTKWEELLEVRRDNMKAKKLPLRSADNKAPDPPAQLPPPIKIIWDGQVYDGIPQNSANSTKSSHPFSLSDGVSYQGWLNFEDAGYDYFTLNKNGEGGILMFPCTREQGRKNQIVDPSRICTKEFQPWFKFGINKKTGLPNLSCCTSDRSK